MTDLFNFSGRQHRQQEITSIAEQPFDLFDDASVKAFETLTKKIQDSRSKSSELHKKLSNYVEDNGGIPTSVDMELFDEIMDLAFVEYWANEHLNALSEMKIVYLFKSVEITMKSLIHTAYPKINTKDFFQWDSMASYFKSINIKLSDFDGYLEVTELRKVNNSIKHNNTINEDISKIREFTGDTQFTYINIGNFHGRIKPKIQNFIKLLGQSIIKDLYVFDDSRVEKISNDFKLRMEDEVLNKLASKLTDGLRPRE